ncbi:MAG TPA: hypothetical protein PLB62_06970, partial [Candidatus Sumerlaeota bacterium]|nr:hypothetical protein [Candidatus Sumerlaeota bacterium]
PAKHDPVPPREDEQPCHSHLPQSIPFFPRLGSPVWGQSYKTLQVIELFLEFRTDISFPGRAESPADTDFFS